jgi:penicillin-binding protein 1B
VEYMKRLLFFSIICLGLVALLFITISSLNAYREMRKMRTGTLWHVPTRIYSSEVVITPGTDISRIALLERLSRLRYRKRSAASAPGEYSVSGEGLVLYLHPFFYPDGRRPASRVRLTLDGTRVTGVISGSGVSLSETRLEPECIAQIFDGQYKDREIITLKDCPSHLLNAILCVEDRRFYEHSGIDVRSIARALLSDLHSGRILEGGSTITQQLVKNLFLTNERTIIRKLKEAWLSVIMETAFSKDEILGMYVNEVYLGQSGYAGINGFGRASRLFFDKDVSQVSLPEAALLAGLVRAPNRYSPYTQPGLALSRRNTVLDVMKEEGMITRQAWQKAKQSPINVVPLDTPLRQAPYFIDYVLSAVHDLYPDDEILSRGGLRIFTTLDMRMQRTVEQVLANGMGGLGRDIEASGVIMNPLNGEIMAMVGGRMYAGSQFNRACSIQRSIGSLIKPIIYYCALKKGYTLSSFIEDNPLSVPIKGEAPWIPSNFDNQDHGKVMLINALARSYNLATVRLGLSLGLDAVIPEIKAVLPRATIKNHPSLLLGAVECSPLDVTSMYCVFANGGCQVNPLCIRGIVDSNDALVWKAQRGSSKRILEAGSVYLINTALLEAMKHGTASRTRSYGVPEGVCGKTGTTNDLRDSWFAAYTQDMALVVWLGKDNYQPSGLSGATGALPLASRILASLAVPNPWDIPDTITFCSIDPANGLRASGWTSSPLKFPYLKGTEPTQVSREGEPAFWRFLKAIFKS